MKSFLAPIKDHSFETEIEIEDDFKTVADVGALTSEPYDRTAE